MTNVTITLTEQQMAKLQSILATRPNQTSERVANTIVERGLYDLAYRTKRNKDQWAQFKAFKQSQRSE